MTFLVVRSLNLGGTSGAESRVLATLLTSIDGVDAQPAGSNVFLFAATNRLDAIDDALLRKVWDP
jgi:SpoVK/Ycf46/Vps4 family AAA+-type ATPase